MALSDEELKNILSKYDKKLAERFGQSLEEELSEPGTGFSREYNLFKDEVMSRRLTFYEKACAFAAKSFKVSASPKDREAVQKAIDMSHLDVTPDSAASFSVLIALVSFLIGILINLIVYLMYSLNTVTPRPPYPLSAALFGMIIILAGFMSMKQIAKLPINIANKWRLEASSQMVLCILYIVMFMRHTSNLEHAIKFAGEHISGPLALDLRKVYWDVEVEKYSTIKESLDRYLADWRDYSLEFVESFHLIEGSLYEPSENKRVEMLEKALQVMLDGMYEKMLHYTHDVRSPITTLHMVGVILPILGLIILPLVGTFMGVKWYHLALLYNILLPFGVYFFGSNLLAKKPVGYGEVDLLKQYPEYEEYRYVKFGNSKVSPMSIAIVVGVIFLFIGFLPLILHAIGYQDIFIGDKDSNMNLGWLLGYRETDLGQIVGPFGIASTLLGLMIPLGLGLAIGTYYYLSNKQLVVIRNNTKRLEREFAGSLFQFGNRVGDGLPSEMAFAKVADTMAGTPTGDFFKKVDTNLRRFGMSMKEAIFGKERGAIFDYPSSLIDSSMRVLLEGARRGPHVVSKSLISISVYMDRIHAVAERMKDLLAEVVSSMKGQIGFLTPMIAGIVVGIGSMITGIIGGLSSALTQMPSGETGTGAMIDASVLFGLFPPDKIIPPYYFQLVVGLYVMEVIIILTFLSSRIEAGADRLSEQYSAGKNLYRSMFFYTMISAVVILIFNVLAIMVTGISLSAGGGFS